MTIDEARTALNRLADEATDENYHTEAEAIRKAADELDSVTVRTIIWVPSLDGVVKLEVTP